MVKDAVFSLALPVTETAQSHMAEPLSEISTDKKRQDENRGEETVRSSLNRCKHWLQGLKADFKL